jgi:hypothetical protein
LAGPKNDYCPTAVALEYELVFYIGNQAATIDGRRDEKGIKVVRW